MGCDEFANFVRVKLKSMIDVISDFEELQKKFGLLLDKSGYGPDFLANKIGMKSNNFNVKKSQGGFTLSEMKELLKIIWKPEMEDVVEGEILKKSDKGDYASAKEIKEAFA